MKILYVLLKPNGYFHIDLSQFTELEDVLQLYSGSLNVM